MAIASDRDIYAMFKVGVKATPALHGMISRKLFSKDREFPLDIASAIRELKPPIEVDEHGGSSNPPDIVFSGESDSSHRSWHGRCRTRPA